MLSVLDLPVIDKQIFIENQFEYRFQASKIIHRIIFEISLYTQSVLENFFHYLHTKKKDSKRSPFSLLFYYTDDADWGLFEGLTKRVVL